MVMNKSHLYLLVGYPGSGKTTVAKIIHEKSGAEHLWTDWERRSMFDQPTHSDSENIKLYSYLNTLTGQMLNEGKSVIFDTNFNFKKDRDHLKKIAEQNNAKTWIIWVNTSRELSKKRATEQTEERVNRVLGRMSAEDFDRIADHLQAPQESEAFIKIDGTDVDKDALIKQLSL